MLVGDFGMLVVTANDASLAVPGEVGMVVKQCALTGQGRRAEQFPNRSVAASRRYFASLATLDGRADCRAVGRQEVQSEGRAACGAKAPQVGRQ